jgi:cyclic di-GMP phosphodiesterase Gmr
VTERRAVERALHARANIDELTGLLNRSAIVGRIKELLCSGPTTVGFVDLDNFKHVNDTHGHAVGDAVLVAVAQRLLRAAGTCAAVGRWGGDEFLVVAPGQAVSEVTGAVDRLIADPVEVGGVVWWPSASLGVVAGEQGDDPANLIRDADRLMYGMKVTREQGRNAAL